MTTFLLEYGNIFIFNPVNYAIIYDKPNIHKIIFMITKNVFNVLLSKDIHDKIYSYVCIKRKDEQHLKVFSRSINKICYSNCLITIPKRFILSRAVQTTAKMGAEVVTPVLITEGLRQYLTFIVNDLGSVQDTSKCGHKTISKVECETLDCDTRNCANDNSACDIHTQIVAVVGHLTQSTRGVEEEKTTVELKNTIGPRGAFSHAVIYNEKESFSEKKLYEGYHYAETISVQEEENTSALNKLTQNMSELTENDKQE